MALTFEQWWYHAAADPALQDHETACREAWARGGNEQRAQDDAQYAVSVEVHLALTCLAQALVRHWRKFGDTHGWDECVNALDLASQTPSPSHDVRGALAQLTAGFEAQEWLKGYTDGRTVGQLQIIERLYETVEAMRLDVPELLRAWVQEQLIALKNR